MGVHERVREAVSASTARAEKLLDEAVHADEHARLTILVNGWFQGIAAALEEIALELDARSRSTGDAAGSEPSAVPVPSPSTRGERPASAEETQPREAERSPGSNEAALLEQARQSTKETQALRAEHDPAGDESRDS